MLKHSNTENSVLFPKQEKDDASRDSLRAVRNGLAFVMIMYEQSHTVEVTIKEFSSWSFWAYCFWEVYFALFSHLSLPSWLGQKFSYILRRNKNGQKERTHSVLFKLCYPKIALKNRHWNYGKEISVEFQYDWRNLHSLQEWEKGTFLWISGRNMIICLTTCLYHTSSS